MASLFGVLDRQNSQVLQKIYSVFESYLRKPLVDSLSLFPHNAVVWCKSELDYLALYN